MKCELCSDNHNWSKNGVSLGPGTHKNAKNAELIKTWQRKHDAAAHNSEITNYSVYKL